MIRRAKESLNGIEAVDVKRAYRYEQGFTFEVNLWGDSDELRQAFVEKRDADLPTGRRESSGERRAERASDRNLTPIPRPERRAQRVRP